MTQRKTDVSLQLWELDFPRFCYFFFGLFVQATPLNTHQCNNDCLRSSVTFICDTVSDSPGEERKGVVRRIKKYKFISVRKKSENTLAIEAIPFTIPQQSDAPVLSDSNCQINSLQLFRRTTEQQFQVSERRSFNRIMHVRSLELIEHATIMIPREKRNKSCYHTSSRIQGVLQSRCSSFGGVLCSP